MKVTTSISIPGRVEICSFASLVRAYEKEGLRLRSKSDTIWQAVEQLSTMYAKLHKVAPFTDVREAIAYMAQIGMPLDTNTRATQSIAMAKICQDAEEDYGLDNLKVMTKKVRVEDRLREQNTWSEKDAYDVVVNRMRSVGMTPISFEEYISRKKGGEI